MPTFEITDKIIPAKTILTQRKSVACKNGCNFVYQYGFKFCPICGEAIVIVDKTTKVVEQAEKLK